MIENPFVFFSHSLCVCVYVFLKAFLPPLFLTRFENGSFFASHPIPIFSDVFHFSLLRMFSLTVYALISWPCNFFLSLTLSTTHNHLHALLPYISQCIFLFSFLRPVFFHNFYILAAFSLPLKRHSLASCQAEFCVINLNRTDWYLTLIFALAFSIITIGFATRFEICFCILFSTMNLLFFHLIYLPPRVRQGIELLHGRLSS